MNVFQVPVTIRNWQDRFLRESERAGQVMCDAWVDSGARTLSLPAGLVERLKLMELGQVRARTADGVRHEYRLMGVVELEVQGRSWVGRVIELPPGAEPLLGSIPLEEMDWHIVPGEERLVPSPQSPDMPEAPLLKFLPGPP